MSSTDPSPFMRPAGQAAPVAPAAPAAAAAPPSIPARPQGVNADSTAAARAAAEFGRRVGENVGRAIVGKHDVVELLLVALLADGHVLLEDVPGVGKTTLARAVAASIEGRFSRIQCTPDLLPSDVTGLNYFNQKDQEFRFRSGPVFTNFLLADEINRATPRTQSALLQAMQERQVTLETETHSLPLPFLVLATQNPIELEGTFPLPEAQMDRFLLRLKLGYPALEEEDEMLTRFERADPLHGLAGVASTSDVAALQQQVRTIHVSDDVRRYILELVRATRTAPAVSLGASPRGSLALYRAAQALAALRGRDFVIPSDVQHLTAPVLVHRIHLSPQMRLRGRTAEQVVADVVAGIPVPVTR